MPCYVPTQEDMLTYQAGELHIEGVSLQHIADFFDTPAYVYSTATLTRRYQEFETALAGLNHMICYAIKANSNQAILQCLANLGAGFDAVSEGEITRALKTGVSGNQIVFAGVGKTQEELRFAVQSGVCQINVESEAELSALNEVAQSLGLTASIAVRVNPDIDAKTHHKISTGRADDKFGIPISRIRDIYQHAASQSHLKVIGLAMHIGSQLTDLAPYRNAFRTARELIRTLHSDGHEIHRLDLGGGLGISYHAEEEAGLPTASEYGALIDEHVSDLGCQILIEPGRSIAGPAGVLLTKAIYIKSGATRTFAVVDAAMNDLLRPALYNAHHQITHVRQPSPEATHCPYDIVGPVCESADTFAVQRSMPVINQGDLLIFEAAGAYGAVMASEYNTRPLIPEILVQNNQFAAIRDRPSIDEIVDRDHIPSWVKIG